MNHAVICRRVMTVILVLGLCFSIGWAAVLEDGSGSACSYANLTPQSGGKGVGWSDPPSSRYLAQSSNRRAAQAVYLIRDATMARVSVYSRYGSFASLLDGCYARGNLGEGEYRLRYSTRDGQVYLDGARMLYDPESPSGYLFQPAEDVPGGLVDYGLNVYWSEDGEEYVRADTQMTEYAAEDGAHYYETYEADLDPGARFLKLVLYDQASIGMAGRAESYEFTAQGGLAIATVEIDGRLYNPQSSSGGGEAPRGYGDGSDWLEEEESLGAEIAETAPQGTVVTPVFPDVVLPETALPEKEVPKTSVASSAASKTKKSGAGGEIALKGENHYLEEAPAPAGEIIRPKSLGGGEETFLDRLNTPEGIAILFFSLVCLLLAVKMIVKE